MQRSNGNKKQSEIKFNIELDDSNIPERITWEASDSPDEEAKDCKSIMLSIWDHEEKNTLRIDLWTKDMRLDEMDSHFFQTLITLAESYQRATNHDFVVNEMTGFCKGLAARINEQVKSKKTT